MTNATHFFFYGTLMSTEGNNYALDGLPVEHVTAAQVRGDLYSNGSYPQLVDGDGTVTGELWRATDEDLVPEILRRLDGMEGYRADDPLRSMYLREWRPLLAPAGIEAYVYVWNRPLDHLDHLDHGDWMQRPRERWETGAAR